MYTRANLWIRLFAFVISALFRRAQLKSERNHLVLRNGEEGASAIPLDSKGLINLHIVTIGLVLLGRIVMHQCS